MTIPKCGNIKQHDFKPVEGHDPLIECTVCHYTVTPDEYATALHLGYAEAYRAYKTAKFMNELAKGGDRIMSWSKGGGIRSE